VTDASGTAKRRATHHPRRDPDELPDIQQLLAVTAAALLVGVMYIVLPDQLTIKPNWLLLAAVAVALAPSLIAALIMRRALPYRVARGLALALLAVLTAALVDSLALLVINIGSFVRGGLLLLPATLLWASNVLVFAVWYWEIDGGGPVHRRRSERRAWDFAFAQHQMGSVGRWLPSFVDYLFLAFNTSTALSPTDTYPLRPRVKLLMMAQSVISLLIIVLIIGRSVNIL
jgi:hypothetical protein